VTIPVDEGDVASFAIADVLSKPLRTAEVVAAMAPFSLPGRSPDDRAARVLVVDDDPAALELMRVTLNGMHIEAVCMLDGRRALEELDQHRPDAIILDLMMPGFDGFAVLDALRRSSSWHTLPVFIWTSLILTDDEYETLAYSAQAILTKGGGALEGMLQKLSHWRPVATFATGGDEA
jgi:CheY-like chemotaxis protein